MTMTELETIPHGAGRRQTRSVAASLPPGWAYRFARTPYSAGAGLRPAALVGRDIELQDWSLALQRLRPNGLRMRAVPSQSSCMACVVKDGQSCWGSFTAWPRNATG